MSETPTTNESKRTRSDDVLSVGTPQTVDLDDPEAVELWERAATGVAKQYVWSQYQRPPFDLEFGEIEVLITRDPAEIDAFYEDHIATCETCREGVKVTKAYLAVEEGQTATLLRIPVVEVW